MFISLITPHTEQMLNKCFLNIMLYIFFYFSFRFEKSQRENTPKKSSHKHSPKKILFEFHLLCLLKARLQFVHR